MKPLSDLFKPFVDFFRTPESEGASLRPPPPNRDLTRPMSSLMMDERQRRATPLEIGQQVRKTGGYRFPGEVRAAITKRDGRIVYAVECTAPDCEGMLHIFSRDQLELS